MPAKYLFTFVVTGSNSAEGTTYDEIIRVWARDLGSAWLASDFILHMAELTLKKGFTPVQVKFSPTASRTGKETR